MITKQLKRIGLPLIAVGAVVLISGCGAYAHGNRHTHAGADDYYKHPRVTSPMDYFEQGDADGNGTLSMDEALAWSEERARARTERMFEHLDLNEDGEISREEFEGMRRGWWHRHGKGARDHHRRYRAEPSGS